MRAVTLKVKRYKYVSECPTCKGLFASRRSDAITCGTDCRVWAHRHGNIEAIKNFLIDDNRDYHPALVCQFRAAIRLIPDLFALAFCEELNLDDHREEIWRAYREYLKQSVETNPVLTAHNMRLTT